MASDPLHSDIEHRRYSQHLTFSIKTFSRLSPESPRLLLTQGKVEKASKIIRLVMRINRCHQLFLHRNIVFWSQQCCPRNGFYTQPPSLKKAIAFFTAKTNFVLHNCIPNKTKTKIEESRLNFTYLATWLFTELSFGKRICQFF